MSIKLATPLPKLAGDMMDVYRVFYGPADCVLCPQETAELVHRFKEQDGNYKTHFAYQGHEAQMSVAIPQGNEIVQKRVIKRLIKQTLYDLLKAITGVRPPWGSLTGIRPTRLFYEQLEEGRSMEEAQSIMETKYDLLPEKAKLLREIVHSQKMMPKALYDQVDVYIGIPFCLSLCAYCSFASGEIGNGKLVPPYLEALEKEMQATAALIKECGLTLRALYVGGGTPTSLNENQFQWLIDTMNHYFPGAMEVTVEAGRPDTITKVKLEALKNGGVTRISINPQSFNDKTLALIGRNHSEKDVFDAYRIAREVGISHINMDMIAGLPGETLGDFEYSMEQVHQLRPESLTIHTLALKRSSRLHLEGAVLPDSAQTSQMVSLGAQTAKALSLSPYYLYRQKYMAGNQENVGYALQGHACLYNVDMMEETLNILGVGAGAMSKRLFGAENRIERAPNVSDILTYLQRTDEMILRKRLLWNRE